MGWFYPTNISRKELIKSRTKSFESESSGVKVATECLRHCFRGGVFSGVLWSVWKRTFVKDGVEVEPEQRWICCDLVRCHGGEWGYKDMDESCHPFYYSCPLGYLNLVPSRRLADAKNGETACMNTTLNAKQSDSPKHHSCPVLINEESKLRFLPAMRSSNDTAFAFVINEQFCSCKTKGNRMNKPLFELGQVVATPPCLAALKKAGQAPDSFLKRHVIGDWGNIDEHDSQVNEDCGVPPE